VTRVSVIIPAYNAADYVDSSLGSVAAQTRPPDEVIVVDDGSTDDTVARAELWTSLIPLRILRLPENIGRGRGAGGARAHGIEHSTGDVVALLDVDDVWFPDHLDIMLRELERTPAPGLVTANHLLWIPGDGVGGRPASELVPVPPPEEQRMAIISANFVFVSTVFTRSLYDDVGPMRNIRCEDWDLWIRMVDAGAVISMPSQVTALYRQASHSVSGTDKLLVGDIDLLEEHLSGRPADERAVIERALRRRRARQHYLRGLELVSQGQVGAGRRSFLRSIRADPSLRGTRSKLNGSVAVRSAACLIAPRTMVRLRDRRQADSSFVVGERGGVRDVLKLTG
jgi:hypothetical protein